METEKELSRRRFVQLIGLSGAASLLAACGSTTAPAGSTVTVEGGTGSGATPVPARGVSSVPATGAASGAKTATRDKLTIGLNTEPGSLDASTDVNTTSRLLFINIYDPLVHRDAQGKLVGKLAESWEQVNDTTLRFHLRKGVTFHNGEEFTADSVKFSFGRYADPKSQAAAKTSTIQEVRVIDPYTADVITKDPDPILIGNITDGFFMLPSKYYQEKGATTVGTQPVGTGPFVFKEWTKADHITMTANKDYWGGAPKVQTVTFRFIPEDATRVAGLQTGELDITVGLPPALANQLKSNKDVTLSTALDPAIVHVGLKCNDPILKDPRVRQALNYATNKDLLIQRVLFGFATAAGQVASPDAFGYNPEIKPYPYDPDKAKQLLADAGYANGFEIAMDAPIGYVTQANEVSQAIIGDWGKVGVKAKVTLTEYATYNKDKLLSPNRAGLAPTYVMLKRYPSLDVGETMITAFPTNAQWNYDLYSNPQVDDLIKKQATTLDQNTRKQALLQIEQTLHDDAPYVWLYWAQWIHGMRKGITYHVRPDGLIDVFDDVSF